MLNASERIHMRYEGMVDEGKLVRLDRLLLHAVGEIE